MTVYLLFHETNTGHSDESDGYVEAVYATFELADAARLAAIRAAIAEGFSVWHDPDAEDWDERNEEWAHDWSVQTYEVREHSTLPTDGFFDFLKSACQGHPAGPYDPLGQTVYCDGTCRR